MKSRAFAAVLFAALATVDARAGSIAPLPLADTASLPTLTGRVVKFTGPVAAGDHSLVAGEMDGQANIWTLPRRA